MHHHEAILESGNLTVLAELVREVGSQYGGNAAAMDAKAIQIGWVHQEISTAHARDFCRSADPTRENIQNEERPAANRCGPLFVLGFLRRPFGRADRI